MTALVLIRTARGVAITLAVALLTAVNVLPASADLNNVVTTPSGGQLKSWGVCGPYESSFTVSNRGMEWVMLETYNLQTGERKLGAWGQLSDYKYQLPLGFSKKVYYAWGADWNGLGWDYYQIQTSFDYFQVGYFSRGFC